MRVGQGFDAHRLVEGRRLVLGGVEIDYSRGLEGHSDGDVLIHALADALLGAMGQGDLGQHFPSSDESLRDVDSAVILERVVSMMGAAGYALGSADCTVVAQVPRLAPEQPAMRARLAKLLGVPESLVNLKVTSTDGLGWVGREEGIASLVVVLLKQATDAEGSGRTHG